MSDEFRDGIRQAERASGKSKEPSAFVLERLRSPALFLYYSGLLTIAYGLVATVVSGVMLLAVKDAALKSTLYSGLGSGLWSLLLGALVTFGAGGMKERQRYGWALVAAACSTVSCLPCCLLTMPAGLWSFVVLLDYEVKSSFQSSQAFSDDSESFS